MPALTKTELRLHQDATACYICGKRFSKKFAKVTNYRRARDHYHFTCKCREEAHGICNLNLNVPSEISVFYSGSNYDYHFIIKELANQFECLACLGENPENYENVSVPIQK